MGPATGPRFARPSTPSCTAVAELMGSRRRLPASRTCSLPRRRRASKTSYRPTNYETTPSPMDRIQRRLGPGLTPQSITVTQRAADEGTMALWADLLDEVRQGDTTFTATSGEVERRGRGLRAAAPTSAGSAQA